MTKGQHLAGTELSKEQADYVAEKLRTAGFDKVKIHMYTVLLSYPEKPGQVQVKSATGSIIHKFDVIEPAVHKSENASEVVLPFNAYSPAKTVEVRNLRFQETDRKKICAKFLVLITPVFFYAWSFFLRKIRFIKPF